MYYAKIAMINRLMYLILRQRLFTNDFLSTFISLFSYKQPRARKRIFDICNIPIHSIIKAELSRLIQYHIYENPVGGNFLVAHF